MNMHSSTATSVRNSGVLGALPVWWGAARPKTLWAAVAPVSMAGAIAYYEGSRNFFVFGIILLTAILIQVATNFANDLIDARKGTDAVRIGPARAVQSGLLSDGEITRGLILVLGAALLLGACLVYIGGLPILAMGLTALVCTIWYSAGPAALSYTGLADIFVLAFFGPIATAGTVYLLTASWSVDAAVVGFAPGFISIAVLTANNLRDFWTDRQVNKKTLVVRFGLLFGRIEYTACILAACLIPLLCVDSYGLAPWFGAITLFAAVPHFIGIWQARDARAFLPLLPQTAKLLILNAGLFCIGLFLS